MVGQWNIENLNLGLRPPVSPCINQPKTFLSPGGGRGGEWGPADGVAADGVGVGDLLLLPAAGGVHVAQHRHGPVARAADQDEAELVRRPADRVDRGVVVAVLVELGPAARGVLAPQDDLKDSMASHTSGNIYCSQCMSWTV